MIFPEGCGVFVDDFLLDEIQPSDDMIYNIWEPRTTTLVLGFHNRPHRSVYTDRILMDRIMVNRRLGGGEPFLFQPGTIVLSCVKWAYENEFPKETYFFFNNLIKKCLEFNGIDSIEYRNINELAIKGRLIMTSCLHSMGDMIMFQAVVFNNLELNEKFLYLNIDENPLYPVDLSHYSSLNREGFHFTADSLINSLDYYLKNFELFVTDDGLTSITEDQEK
ncbi:MAG: hypothetical protein KBA26_08345 [Candidatus Delongbacteria bacterium]|nr:hypothetical protein [Candidatus Delongbacteria bacterium]